MAACTYIRASERCDAPATPRPPDGRLLCDEHWTEVQDRRDEHEEERRRQRLINHERRMNRRASDRIV